MIVKFIKKCEPIGKEGRGKFYQVSERIVMDAHIGRQYIEKGVAVEVPKLFEEVTVVTEKKKAKAKH